LILIKRLLREGFVFLGGGIGAALRHGVNVQEIDRRA